MFNVKCLTCGKGLGECADLLAMADLVLPHVDNDNCASLKVEVTCQQCQEVLVTGPAIWVNSEDAAFHDTIWESNHQHEVVA